MAESKRVGFYTLGCKLNFAESSTLARAFEKEGYTRVAEDEPADIYVINSCSVTEHADKKCRNIVRRIIRHNPHALVAVTGCYAQLKPSELAAIEGVDLVVGNNDKGSLFQRITQLQGKARAAAVHTCEAEALTGLFAAFSTGDRTRSFLKVQDGCSYRCSYCTIPLARGASRNQPIAQIVDEARQIAAQGQHEIVLTGVNIGDFGRTTGESFLELLKALDTVEGIDRYRISSIEPNLLTHEVIDFTAQSRRFQPHFHIPIQSGSDRILSLMRRRYNTARFAERIAAVKRVMPDAFIGIDVIVGFPGETEADFQTTYDFLQALHPSFLHVFPYSVRPDTPAATMPDQIPPPVAEERAARLGQLSHQLHAAFYHRHEGASATVLWESAHRGTYMYGYTGNYIKVRAPYDLSLVNTITSVMLHASDDPELMDTEAIG